MNRNRIALSIVLALSAPLASAQQSIDKVNGSITAQAGQAYGELETVNGSIAIEARATTSDASTVNGSIRVDDGARTGDLETVNGSIRLGSQVQVADSIETVNGSVFIDRGGRAGSIETVNGAIGLVDTDLSGGIETVNGSITVGAGSHVRGGIHVEKPSKSWFNMGKRQPPRIVIGPNAVVEGPLVFEQAVKLYVHQTARTGRITGATAVRYTGERAPAD